MTRKDDGDDDDDDDNERQRILWINAPMNFRSTSCRIRTILCVVQTDSDVFHIVRSFPVNNIYEHPSIPIVMLQNSFCAFLRTFEIVVSKLIIHRLDLSKKCVFSRGLKENLLIKRLVDRSYFSEPFLLIFYQIFYQIDIDQLARHFGLSFSFRWLFPSLFENRSDFIRI